MDIKARTTQALGSLAVVVVLSAATPAWADAVTDWNALTVTFVTATGVRSAFPDIALVQLAVHDAVQAYQGRFQSYGAALTRASGSPAAAVAAAARDVLVARLPGQIVAIDAAYQTYVTTNGLLGNPGLLVGQQAALNVLIRRGDDRGYPPNPEIFTGGTGPGDWRPTPPAFAPMTTPWMGGMKPIFLNDTGRLLPEPPPPHLTSGEYAEAYNEVKALGARFGSSRTPEQTTVGYFYSDNYPNQMNRMLRGIVEAQVPDIGDRARLLALANGATADAIISAWDLKRTYHLWRPSTAIHEGDSDDNPATVGDSGWLPLINDPPYPDYTSGANSIAGAVTRTLALFFKSDALFTFTATSVVAQLSAEQKTRSYARFSDLADDVENARVYLGIHFRFADTVGRRQGKQSADWAFAHALRPRH